MGVGECGQKKDSYKRELKEMRAMVKEAHRAGKAAKVRVGVHAAALRGVGWGWLRVVVRVVGRRMLMVARCSP